MAITRIRDHQVQSETVYRQGQELAAIKEEVAEARVGRESLAQVLTDPTLGLEQITKLGVVASPEEPKVIEVPISRTQDFKRRPPEVLKFVPGPDDVSLTVCDFNNDDATDFDASENVVFDGVMKLKTKFIEEMTDEGELGDDGCSRFTTPERFKKIEGIKVE